MTDQDTGRRGVSMWAGWAVGALFGLIGAVLTVGGLWLLLVGGSANYLIAGVALVAAGFFVFRRRPLGLWIYAATYVATITWAVWEVGLNGWALGARIVGSSVLMLLALAAAPLLLQGRMRARVPIGGLAALSVICLGLGAAVAAASNTDVRPLPLVAERMADASFLMAGDDWPAYGGSQSARRYSPLTQITPENVSRLQRFWVAHTGDLPKAEGDNKYGAETTPLKVGNSVYLCSAKNILISLDAATGKERWRFDPKANSAGGVCAARIIEGTLDGRLIAVDAATGRPCPDFGRNGQVDVKQGMGPVVPGMVAITSPPALVRGVLVTGQEVLDGQKNDAPSGVIQGFDAMTGKTVWKDILPAGGQATPMTYTANGRQYVVVMAGGRHFMKTPIGDAVIAYALPGS